MVNLTDQELNEWVANNIFDNDLLIISKYWGEESSDFCGNLNASHLMEEKIIEMNKWGEFCDMLLQLQIGEDNKYKSVTVVWSGDYHKAIHSKARQRCEAAYLTFKKDGK